MLAERIIRTLQFKTKKCFNNNLFDKLSVCTISIKYTAQAESNKKEAFLKELIGKRNNHELIFCNGCVLKGRTGRAFDHNTNSKFILLKELQFDGKYCLLKKSRYKCRTIIKSKNYSILRLLNIKEIKFPKLHKPICT